MAEPEAPAVPAAERGTFSIWQDGVRVAGGTGPWEAIQAEAHRYAAQYRQDGPVRLILRRFRQKANPDATD